MSHPSRDYLMNSCIAAPCPVGKESGTCADAGTGSGRKVSTCQTCGLFVYDLDGVSATQAGDLTLAMEALPTPRFFRRRDGRYLTRNCPVGLADLKARLRQNAG